MATTLLLDRAPWDLCLDASGNIAVAAEPYAPLQDAASGVRTWAGECWYDTTLGVSYRDRVFDGPTPVQVLRAQAAREAERTPGVKSVQVLLGSVSGRRATGQVQVTLDTGQTLVTTLG